MATTGVPNALYESNDAPDLVSGAFATHTHDLALDVELKAHTADITNAEISLRTYGVNNVTKPSSIIVQKNNTFDIIAAKGRSYGFIPITNNILIRISSGDYTYTNGDLIAGELRIESSDGSVLIPTTEIPSSIPVPIMIYGLNCFGSAYLSNYGSYMDITFAGIAENITLPKSITLAL